MSRFETLRFINAAHFFDHFFLLIFPTAALAIARDWEISYGEALALGTPIFVMFGLGTLPAGWLGDRMDRLNLLALFFFGCGVSSLVIALSPGAISMMAGLGFLGFFASLYHPVGLALVTGLGGRTGRALAVNGVAGNLGLAGAAVLTGILATYGGWQSAFAVPGAVSIVIGGALFLRNRHHRTRSSQHVAPQHNDVAAGSLRTQITVFGVICVAALFGGLVYNVITISLPKFFDERLIGIGGDLAWIGASTGLVFAIAAFAQLPVGELLDRYGPKSLLMGLVAAQVILLVALATATGWAALVIALVLVTMVFAQIPITSWLLGHYVRSSMRARAASVEYVLSLGMGAAVVPLIAGLHGAGLGFDFQYFGIAISAAVVLAAALVLPRGRAVSTPVHAQSAD
ncbi:MAG: MFS transporter [Alphaproteobacteria bacterium]|jgi:MFS family permease|nr:MFS transporter [Alphaproteobacteria bacterium]